jgi:elongation factor P
MIAASQLRTGMAIRFENQTYKVLAADYQPGQGKMGGVMHARLKNLVTGTTWEHGFRAELKLQEIPVEKRAVGFLYQDADESIFMDPETYEQTPVPNAVLGDQARLLVPDMKVSIEFVDGKPVSITLPDVLELKVADTAPPVHGSADSTWKTAHLENGVQIMVPQFVKTGDMIRLSTAEMKYMDRGKAHTH